MISRIISQLNIISQCRRYGLPLWQCPQFLFLIMGFIIILASLVSYLIGNRYITEPSLVALIVIGISFVLIIISFIITRSFERLAEASRMKSEFINITSHQLRSPITNIKWIAEFLTSEDIEMSSEKRQEYLHHLKENTSRMVELVDELLVVSRIERGSFPVRKRKASLKQLIEELISRSKVFAEASNISIKFYPEKNLPETYFDVTLIRMVIENLVDNAIRYTRGKGKVEIYLKKKNNNLYLAIKDNGVGIPKSDQPHIFKKFFRSENVLREHTRGSGLGLYIARSIIEGSGGKIWFSSKEGKGTTFYFTLPVK